MPKIESEKIDCLYRPCSRPAPRGKIESVRSHSEVIEQFDSFSLLKLLFLVRNWHCWSRKAFPRQMTPQSREKAAKTAIFRHRWQAWKVVRLIAAVRQRPRTPRNWRCSFAFFETFLWHFNKKQRAEVIFRLSRPVSCKNQENGSGKRWSLHAPLKDGIEISRIWSVFLVRFSIRAFAILPFLPSYTFPFFYSELVVQSWRENLEEIFWLKRWPLHSHTGGFEKRAILDFFEKKKKKCTGTTASGRQRAVGHSFFGRTPILDVFQSLGVPWAVWVWTSDVIGAGTDASVYIQLYGEQGKSRAVEIDNAVDNFERGELDKFQVSTGLDISQWQSCMLKVARNGVNCASMTVFWVWGRNFYHKEDVDSYPEQRSNLKKWCFFHVHTERSAVLTR